MSRLICWPTQCRRCGSDAHSTARCALPAIDASGHTDDNRPPACMGGFRCAHRDACQDHLTPYRGRAVENLCAELALRRAA